MNMLTVRERIDMTAELLQLAVDRTHRTRGYTTPPDVVSVKPKVKYTCIDIGTAGAFMVDNDTGELYNIKGYGTPDKNKKKKADLGNISFYNTVEECERLYALRYNYLR